MILYKKRCEKNMLIGTLKTFSLTGLLQICSNENSTGALDFSVKGKLCGRIGFRQGEVVYADFLGMKGIDALRQISLLREIEFIYNKETELGESNIDVDIDYLMIDCTRYQDECLSYMDTLKNNFPGTYSIGTIDVFEYDDPVFRALTVYNVSYFEVFDNHTFQVVYLDKNINARIKIVFIDHVVTESLLVYMKEKGMLK